MRYQRVCNEIRGVIMTIKWIEGILKYNIQNDRYGLWISDMNKWENNGFQCGECLQVNINNNWLDTSMEIEWSDGESIWYLTDTGIYGNKLECVKARIQKRIWD